MAKVPCKSNEYIGNVDIHTNDYKDSATESWSNIMIFFHLCSQKNIHLFGIVNKRKAKEMPRRMKVIFTSIAFKIFPLQPEGRSSLSSLT